MASSSAPSPDPQNPAARLVPDFAAALAAPRPTPAAGSATGVTVALAAALAAKAARLSTRQLPDAAALVPRLDALRDRALALADADVRSVTDMMAGATIDPNAVVRDIAEIAVEVATCVAPLADHGNPALWADAVTAGRLAAAAQESIAAIVASNDGTQ